MDIYGILLFAIVLLSLFRVIPFPDNKFFDNIFSNQIILVRKSFILRVMECLT